MLASLESSPFSAWVRESLWGWPIVLTLHVLGTALVIGFAFIISLRLLGLFETITYTSLNRLFPVVWVAFVLQFLTGFILWMTKPTQYVADGAFALKFSFVVIGIVLMVYIYRIMKREAASWDAAGTVSAHGLKFVAPTLLVWGVVLVAARLTAFLGTLPTG